MSTLEFFSVWGCVILLVINIAQYAKLDNYIIPMATIEHGINICEKNEGLAYINPLYAIECNNGAVFK